MSGSFEVVRLVHQARPRSGHHSGAVTELPAQLSESLAPSVGHTNEFKSIAHSPDGHHIVSESGGETTYLSDPMPHAPIPFSSSSNPTHPQFCLQPDINGWVRDTEDGLLYWVPPDCRTGLHSPAFLMIPLASDVRSVSLDFADFAFGTSWTRIFNGP